MRDLAGDTTLGTMTPVQLYAGEAPIVTYNIKAASGLTFAKYEVYAINAGGEAIKFNPGGSAPATIARGIMAQPIDTAAGWAPVFEAGAFNHEALVWPGSGAGTFALRRSFFAGSDIHIMQLK